MNIFENITRAFGPKATKAPSLTTLERLHRETNEAVEAARIALEVLEAGRVNAVLGGEEARVALRQKITAARDDLAEMMVARDEVAARLEEARLEEAEKARRTAYSKADDAQRAAQSELVAKYPIAVAELIRLRELVAKADRLAEAANNDLPQGAARLLETESVRDAPAVPEHILREEMADVWFTVEGNTPVDAARVTRREGRKGIMYAESSFGPRPVPCELRRVRKVTRQRWTPPVYGARLADLELPDLKAEPGAAPKPVEELVQFAEVADAAE
ncbi:hypothetical protein [Xanthobacter versatilis]|uniref:hypothetical protein n=1 Tax=Xanthobacter autotrophicus (strain ATCC BAA-1158 / Py2) TaxID=78245 RepID=UPI003728D540